jgi:peptide-methionine (S)-S-oxide reductase
MRKVLTAISTILIFSIGLLIFTGCGSMKSETKNEDNNNPAKNIENNGLETAILGGGCFWCIEAVFQQIKGVSSAQSGYAGGDVENPTYEQVCSGNTGHAEVVRVSFDPEELSYRKLLEVFFYIHDPTTLNRQGNDVGTQYRSIIMFTSPEQEKIAKELIDEMEEQKFYADPVVTQIEPLKTFYKAEDYHQSYYENNAAQPYCQLVISPKVEKFQDKFADILK